MLFTMERFNLILIFFLYTLINHYTNNASRKSTDKYILSLKCELTSDISPQRKSNNNNVIQYFT